MVAVPVGSVTVTTQVAVWSPSSVRTVMVAVPAPIALTVPPSTVATVSSELRHVIALLSAWLG